MAGPESATQVTSEIDPKEIVIAYLERAREDWLPHHHRAVRAGGNSGEANRDASDAFKPIDRLLDELGRLTLTGAADPGLPA